MLKGLRKSFAFIALAVLGCAIAAPATAEETLPEDSRSVLARFEGRWTTEARIRRLLPTEHETKTRGRGKCVATLGGRYYEFRTETLPASNDDSVDSELQIMTYDAERRVYRQWVFSSDGYQHEATGQWDSTTTTLRWTGKSGDNSFVIDDRFVGSGQLEWTLTRTNPAGQVVQTITGVLRKDAPPVP